MESYGVMLTKAVLLELQCPYELPGNLVDSTDSSSVGMGLGLSFYKLKKVAGNVHAAGDGPMF